MENIDSVWQISIISLVAGVLIGALAYRLFWSSKEQADQIKTELDATRAELESYKASVNQHFEKTSDLVNDLTQNYVKVHQHLAEGAYTLGDSKTFTNLLEQSEDREAIAVDDEAIAGDDLVDDSIVESADEPAEVVEDVVEEVVETADIETPPEAEIEAQLDKDEPQGEENVKVKNPTH